MSDYIVLPNGRVTKFTKLELACKHCGMFNYQYGVLDKFQDLREELNKPMTPTSGCRCAEHNRNEKGKPNSFHICDVIPVEHQGRTGCMAMDVYTPDPFYRGQLAALAWKHGFSVGYNFVKNFLHLDQRVMIGWQQTTFPY